MREKGFIVESNFSGTTEHSSCDDQVQFPHVILCTIRNTNSTQFREIYNIVCVVYIPIYIYAAATAFNYIVYRTQYTFVAQFTRSVYIRIYTKVRHRVCHVRFE